MEMNPAKSNGSVNLTDTEQLKSLIGKEHLVLNKLGQHSLRSVLLAMGGVNLAAQGGRENKSLQATVIEAVKLNREVRVEKTVTIQNKSPEELYNFWHNFENLPTFMKHLQSVQVLNDKRSHWIAKAPLGNRVEWDAEIISDQENELISWASVEDSDIDNVGFVRFKALPYERGTEVKVVIEYHSPAGGIAVAIAKLFGEEPEQQIGDDLRRFKMLMETGEIATTEGQSTGHK